MRQPGAVYHRSVISKFTKTGHQRPSTTLHSSNPFSPKVKKMRKTRNRSSYIAVT